MIRLAKLTDYGLLLMTTMARKSANSVHNARDLAEITKLPLPTATKVLKQLLQSGLLTSHRGINGGYSLAKEPSEISLEEIIAAIEGPIALTECSTDVIGLCDLELSCPMKANQRVVSEVVRAALQRVMLTDLMQQPLQLTAIRGVDGKLVPAAGNTSGRVQ
jgi:FeS assembly SUF system regulator